MKPVIRYHMSTYSAFIFVSPLCVYRVGHTLKLSVVMLLESIRIFLHFRETKVDILSSKHAVIK